ncbi:SUKH-4 family immunity protein [Saccharibacillus sacchari]|uniref:SUKH-4 family immunity protein n=1 Tax=Saccharibacillus sacchari TaxID=456493 RepID=A0ACC6PK28_9BACL
MSESKPERIFFSPDQLENSTLPESALNLLREGLPQSAEIGHTAGVRFANDLQYAVAESNKPSIRCFAIAYVWERTSEYLVIESVSGEIRACGPGGEKDVFVNTDLGSLLDCLSRYSRFQQRRPSAPEPSIWNAEQARLKLEAFRRGEIRPKTKADEAARSEAEDRQELQALKTFLQQKDPECLKRRESWWSAVLEQLEDRLV